MVGGDASLCGLIKSSKESEKAHGAMSDPPSPPGRADGRYELTAMLEGRGSGLCIPVSAGLRTKRECSLAQTLHRSRCRRAQRHRELCTGLNTQTCAMHQVPQAADTWKGTQRRKLSAPLTADSRVMSKDQPVP